MLKRLALISLSLATAACSTFVPPPTVSEKPQAEPIQAWARVLASHVDAQGRVNFKGLAQNRADLDRYVAWVYANAPANQPGLFPTPQHVLAYHLNAYNALAMYNVIESGIPQTNAGLGKVKFFFLRKVQVGGQTLSLHAYENEVIRKLRDARLHFALNCMSAGCPRLPPAPFMAQTLDDDLDRLSREFFSEARNARVDEAEKTVYLSEILDFYPEDFLAEAPSLIAYANRWRAQPLPLDYRLKFTPYDWTMNAQP